MLTLCSTCGIKNGSKQPSLDVCGRSYVDRRAHDCLPSALCWEKTVIHVVVLCTSVIVLTPNFPLVVTIIEMKDRVKGYKGNGRQKKGSKWDTSCFHFFFSVSPSIRFCYPAWERMWTVWGDVRKGGGTSVADGQGGRTLDPPQQAVLQSGSPRIRVSA